MNYFYKVIYEDKGHQFTEEIEAGNPGTAFAMCLKAHPDCKLVKAFIQDLKGRYYGYIEHLPPTCSTLSAEKGLSSPPVAEERAGL